MPRPLSLKAFLRDVPKGHDGSGALVLRRTASVMTSMVALIATSLVTGPALADPVAEPCELTRSPAHHSEGLDTWNAAYTRPTHPVEAVMIFLSFPDAKPKTTPAELTGDYFPDTNRFFKRASYGRFTVHPHPLRRWIAMPRASTWYAVRRDWNPERRSAYLRDAIAAADKKVDFSRYDIVYFVADPDAPGVDSDATKVVNLETPLRADGTDIRRVVTIFEKHPPDRLVLAHETGHVFDLPDLYHRPADGKGDWDTYVGDWDLMGSQFGLAPDLFAWHKWKLGWLDPRQVVCVRGRVTRLSLEALGAGPTGVPQVPVSAGRPWSSGSKTAGGGGVAGAAGGVGTEAFGSGSGTKLAVVRTGPDTVLAIEARGAVGNDTETCSQGVLLYHVTSLAASGDGPVQVVDAHPHTSACWATSVYPPLADAPLDVGESFTVPGDGVRVEVEDQTPGGAYTVKITKS
ncbi:M6 family metalloprotease domain-containing protein [Streptomyces nodosus]|uniref:M6 family metalloprotease domain-containing protein n=2 Tax=Streptomyces TaxID=1883 RepID=UPI00136B739D|nr:M6 family metalloprotease domain-containing protein [Streptomyces sp. SID2888]